MLRVSVSMPCRGHPGFTDMPAAELVRSQVQSSVNSDYRQLYKYLTEVHPKVKLCLPEFLRIGTAMSKDEPDLSGKTLQRTLSKTIKDTPPRDEGL